MKYLYYIYGMICNGCCSYVEEVFVKVEGVLEIIVDLEKVEVIIVMELYIFIEIF